MIIGIAVTLAVFIGLSVYAGTRVKSAADFVSGAGKSSSCIVAGTIMGTLVGGSSTVGTAQLAYTNGLSAWWFTLGGGIATLILAIGFIKPYRSAGATTLVGIVAGEYGQATGMLASVLSSVGIFINILSQLLSAVAVIVIVAPSLGTVPALIVAALLMVVYVTLGGIKGAGMVGVLKLVLLYFTVVFCAAAVLAFTRGLRPFLDSVGDLRENFGLFSRGFGIDAGAGASLIFGVLTTQTYAQAVLAGKTDRASRAGALISTLLIPPVGIGGILVGLYMRTAADPVVAKNTSLAMTQFILNHVPPFLGGVMLAALLFAVVGTGRAWRWVSARSSITISSRSFPKKRRPEAGAYFVKTVDCDCPWLPASLWRQFGENGHTELCLHVQGTPRRRHVHAADARFVCP
jgi:SSS family solute:Na+ symporter